jgi:Ni,Fe-hydrogenase I cytochrome b subunit
MNERILAALVDASNLGIPKPNGGSDSGFIASVLLPVYFWAGVVAVIVIVVAGFMYTTSGGDPSKLTRAKNAILGAVIGLIFVLMAFVVTSIVLGTFK